MGFAIVLKPLSRLSVTFGSLFFVYAAVGVSLFGGLISVSDLDAQEEFDPAWVYLNFNDFLMALNTLFGIMWQNGW